MLFTQYLIALHNTCMVDAGKFVYKANKQDKGWWGGSGLKMHHVSQVESAWLAAYFFRLQIRLQSWTRHATRCFQYFAHNIAQFWRMIFVVSGSAATHYQHSYINVTSLLVVMLLASMGLIWSMLNTTSQPFRNVQWGAVCDDLWYWRWLLWVLCIIQLVIAHKVGVNKLWRYLVCHFT